MIRPFFALFAAVFCLSLIQAPDAAALGLKVAPLEYRTELKEKEVKKGFIDVSNPSGEKLKVTSEVQAFRQIDNNGGLEFYDEEQVKAGVKLDLKSFELGPREAIRMYFELDGTKLPSGDVFAAIFFRTDVDPRKNGIGQLVRVGTVLSIVNGTPGARAAVIDSLDVPFFQLGDTIRGSYSVRNTSPKGEATGFYPTVTIKGQPFGEAKKSEGSLVFAGNTRINDFSYSAGGISIQNLKVSYGDSSKSKLVVAASPLALVITGLVALLIAIEVLIWRRRKSSRRIR